MRTSVRLSLATLLVTAIGILVPATAAADPMATPMPVASGFDNPRGVAFLDGKLLVAEAGHGGTRCIPATSNEPAACFGRTSQISSVDVATGLHVPLVQNLFSVGEFVNGPTKPPSILGTEGLSPVGHGIRAIIGAFPQEFEDYPCAAGDAGCVADVAAATQEAGALISVKADGAWRKVAGVGADDYDFTANVPGYPLQEHDSNPYGVLAGGKGTYVADAGSNTMDFVNRDGRIQIVHYFPQRYAPLFPTDEVPTCVVRANDHLWVATLSGNLYRMEGTSASQLPNALLKHVTGCASDGENIYLVNMWTTVGPPPVGTPHPRTGDIVKFNTDEGDSTVIAQNLNFPNMDVIGPDGNLYFSADSVCPGQGVTGLCPNGGTVWKLAIGESDEGGSD